MKKHISFIIVVVAILLSACGTAATEMTPSEVNEALLAQQNEEFERACILVEEGMLDEAEVILADLDELEDAHLKLEEIKQLKLRNYYSGTWINTDFSGMDLCIYSDGSGILKGTDGTVDFTYTASDVALCTDCEMIPELLLSTVLDVRVLTVNEMSFFNELDANGPTESEQIEITTENWENYFEIVTECFAKSWRPNGDLDYYCEILYVFPKPEIRERMSAFREFNVSFVFNYDRYQYYVAVDKETFMPVGKNGTPDVLGNSDGDCELNNRSLYRIETGNIQYSDGFAHQSLRDAEYVRYARYYDVAENIVIKNVNGFIFLNP